jgi:hypothetical protein
MGQRGKGKDLIRRGVKKNCWAMAILLPCPYQIVIIKDEDGKEEKKTLFDNAFLVRFSEETGAFADVAGSIYGLFQNLVSCDGALGILISFAPITNNVVGGIGSIFGPIWGTAIFQIIEEISVRYTERVELV